MPIKFKPNYTITPKIAGNLIRIEAAKEKVIHLPLTPTVLNSLRETARLNPRGVFYAASNLVHN